VYDLLFADTVSKSGTGISGKWKRAAKLQMLSRSGLLTFRLPFSRWTQRNDLSTVLFQFGHRAVEVESEPVTANAEQHA
jgi:hypothetical protein